MTVITLVWAFNRNSSLFPENSSLALRNLHQIVNHTVNLPRSQSFPIPVQPQKDIPVFTLLKTVMVGHYHDCLGFYTVEVRGQPLKDDFGTLPGLAQLPTLAPLSCSV